MEQKSTKERILEAALTLFSEKGYDGVGVDQIAQAVGIKGPALYKHFSGKEDVLDTLIDEVSAHYYQNFGAVENIRVPQSLDELKAMGIGQLQFTLHDPNIIKIRKLLTIEQFRNDRFRILATKHFLTGLEEMYTYVFSKMIDGGLLQKAEAKILAFEYVAPISVLVHLADREPDRMEEVLMRIKNHIDYFIQIHGVEK